MKRCDIVKQKFFPDAPLMEIESLQINEVTRTTHAICTWTDADGEHRRPFGTAEFVMVEERSSPAIWERIKRVIRWQNGIIMVFDHAGEQIPELQGPEEQALPKLRAVGWTGTPEERTWIR